MKTFENSSGDVKKTILFNVLEKSEIVLWVQVRPDKEGKEE